MLFDFLYLQYMQGARFAWATHQILSKVSLLVNNALSYRIPNFPFRQTKGFAHF